MSADPASELAPGTRLGSYVIERLLGEGGMGAVYLASHASLAKRVVVKVIHPHYARDPMVRERFFREGNAAARIRHDHVVDVFDVGVEGAVPYLVMEHLEGESLGDLLDRGGQLPPELAIDLLLPVLAAVDAAHAAGVVHRDLKPDNVFVTRTATGEPFPKVLDFGIARVVDERAQGHKTSTAALLGTPSYMAPEQIERAREADAASDQYSLGAVLYHCLTGKCPFEGDSVYGVLKLVGEGRFDAPRCSRPELHHRLEAAVLRAMALRPSERFATLREFGRALLPFATERTRVTWGPTFAAPSSAAHADTAFDISRGGVAPARSAAATMVKDTINDAVSSHDTTAPRRRKSKRGIAPLALAAAATLALVIVAVTWRASSPTPAATPRAARQTPAPTPMRRSVIPTVSAADATTVPPRIAANNDAGATVPQPARPPAAAPANNAPARRSPSGTVRVRAGEGTRPTPRDRLMELRP